MAQAKPVLVPDVSARRIEIRYSFTGAQLLLFGAILYPGGRVPDRPADIVVVLQGPGPADPRAREAEDRRHLDERRIPTASARRPPSMRSPRRGRSPSWSMSAPPRSTSSACRTCSCRPAAARCPKRSGGSRPACSTCASREGLYSENPRGVEISEGVLYRARIAIPSQVPVGTYTAETFLIDRGRVIAAATRDIEIGKSRLRALRRARRPPPRLPLRPRRGAAVAGLGWAAAMRVPPPLLSVLLSQILTAVAYCAAEYAINQECGERHERSTEPAAVRRRDQQLQRRDVRRRRPASPVAEPAADRHGRRDRRLRLARSAWTARSLDALADPCRPVGRHVRPGRQPGQDGGRQQLADRQRPHACSAATTARSSPTSTSSAKAHAIARAA